MDQVRKTESFGNIVRKTAKNLQMLCCAVVVKWSVYLMARYIMGRGWRHSDTYVTSKLNGGEWTVFAFLPRNSQEHPVSIYEKDLWVPTAGSDALETKEIFSPRQDSNSDLRARIVVRVGLRNRGCM
jgi:hypothetical protein